MLSIGCSSSLRVRHHVPGRIRRQVSKEAASSVIQAAAPAPRDDTGVLEQTNRH